MNSLGLMKPNKKEENMKTKGVIFFGVTLLLIVSLILPLGCAKETEEEVELPSAQEIVDRVIESFDNIRTYQIDMDVTFYRTGVGDEGEALESTMAIDYSGAVDVENRQMRIDQNVSLVRNGQPEWEMEREIYLIVGDMSYMMEDLPEEDPMWMKGEAPEGWWEEWQQMGWGESQIELLEAAQVEVMGSERVGGIDCYVLEVTPDLEQLWQLSNHLHFDEAPDVTEEYLQEIFRSFSVKQWVAKDTYFLMKAEIDIAEGLPPDGAGPSTVDIAMVLLSYDYNQPVSIELPPEAVEATQ